jgi:hypothetical protein
MRLILQSLALFVMFSLYCTGCVSDPGQENTWSESSKFNNVGIFSQGMPQRKFLWAEAPHIRICEFSPASKEQVANAAKWWEERGYVFDGISERGLWGGCKKESIAGTITISLSGQGFNFARDHMGETRIYHTPEGGILQARIEIAYASRDSPRVLEHELGHALGWGHYDVTGHIMNSAYSRGGYDDTHISMHSE